MIKLRDWDRLYVRNFDWVLRRMEPDSLKFYKDSEQDWVEAIRAFNKIQLELFDKYVVTYKHGDSIKKKSVKGLELTAEQLFELFHKHMNLYDNHTVRYFIFKWWTDLRHYVKGAEPTLDRACELCKDATKEEIDVANKEFAKYEYDYCGKTQESNHTFDKGIVLEYRDIRFPIDDQWGDAWFKKKNGEIMHFRLDWDWWIPIDECLDLDNI